MILERVLLSVKGPFEAPECVCNRFKTVIDLLLYGDEVDDGVTDMVEQIVLALKYGGERCNKTVELIVQAGNGCSLLYYEFCQGVL